MVIIDKKRKLKTAVLLCYNDIRKIIIMNFFLLIRGLDMKKIKYYLNKKFFMRYFVFFTVALFLIFSVVTIIIGQYVMSQKKYEEQIQMLSEFEDERKTIENTFSIAVALGRMTTESECVKKFTSITGEYAGSDFYTITQIYQNIKQNQTEFHYLDFKMWLFKDSDEIVISGNETITKKHFHNETGIDLSEVVELFANNSLSGYYSALCPNLSSENKMYIACQRIYADGKKIYILISLSNNSYIYAEKYSCGFIMNKNSKIDLFKEISIKSDITETTSVHKTHSKKGNSTICYASVESIPGVLYVASYYDRINIGFIIIGAVLIVLFFASIWFSFLITKYIYSPINRLLGIFEYEEFSGGDELEFIVQNTAEILSANKKLNETLEGKVVAQKNKFLFDLLNGFVWGKGIDEGIAEFSLDYIRKSCVCVAFEIAEAQKLNEQLSVGEFNSIKPAVFEIIKTELFPGYNSGIMVENGCIAFIIPFLNSEKEVVTAVNKVKQKIGVEIVAVVSNPIENLEDYKNEFQDITEILECRYLWGGRDIIMKRDVFCQGGNEYYYSFKTEQALVNNILSGKMENAMILINRVVNRAIRENTSDADFENFKSSIIETIRRMMQRTSITPQDVFESIEEWEIFLKFDDRNQFADKIKLTIKKLICEIDKKTKDDQKRADDKIIEFINQNLSKDISMNDICEEFKMSASTVARRLRERYDISFKNYVDDLRIEKAKSIMMENPNIMIKEVATMVGYANIASFNRMFKRKEGVAPGQYLDKIGKN